MPKRINVFIYIDNVAAYYYAWCRKVIVQPNEEQLGGFS